MAAHRALTRGLGTAALALAAAGCDPGSSPSGWVSLLEQARPLPELRAVSLSTPFAAGCDAVAANGTSYPDAEVEPMVAVNPLNSSNVIGVWQQDRWSTGGAHGVLAAASFDGGGTWAIRQAPFSRCEGGTALNGGDYARATDPWISIGPDGVAYWMALSFFVPELPNAMVVSRSTDGGLSWDAPITLLADTDGPFNDKNAVTADPLTAGYAYAVWDRVDPDTDTGPAWFSRTLDAGLSWEAAKVLHDPGASAQTIGNQIVVLPDGTLVNLFVEVQHGPWTATLRVVRSADHGVNWSTPVSVADLLARGAYDPHTGALIRDGAIIPQIAVGPTGMLYVVWQDSRFSGGARDAIALSMSADGGLSWTTPARISTVAQTQAFTPSITVSDDGMIGVSHFDLRDDTPAGPLTTSTWLLMSTDAVNWVENRVAPDFDLSIAPSAGGYFVGDYQGLKSARGEFQLFFVTANADTANRTDVHFAQRPLWEIAAAKRGAAHVAAEAPRVEMTPEWHARLAEKLERERHHFPDRDIPQYLRR